MPFLQAALARQHLQLAALKARTGKIGHLVEWLAESYA